MTAQRVTCVVNSLAAGGAERAMAWLSSALASTGKVVTLITIFPESHDHYHLDPAVTRHVAPDVVAKSCKWYLLPCIVRRLLALRRAILDTAPDAVISFVDTLNIQVLMALVGTGKKVIVSERIYPPKYEIGPRWRFLRRLTYPMATSVVVQTRATALWSQRQWPRWAVCQIPNPAPDSANVQKSAPPWLGARNIISMGRLAPQKNFELLLLAFARLASEYPEWHLTIVGEGPERDHLTALASSLGIQARLHMPGIIGDPWGILQNGDFFVLPSSFEGFPNVLLEAMVHGLPVISTNCLTGPAEIIRDGIDGILVPTADVGAMAAAMERMMTDTEYRRQLAVRALEVSERFKAASILAQWCRLLEGGVVP